MPLLFSYGTLQQVDVQLSIFGRELFGMPDQLLGFHQSMVKIEDLDVIKKSGKSHHPIVRRTGIDADRVSGTAFEVTTDELVLADDYEVSDYRRVVAHLASGKTAWVYIQAN